MLRILLVLLSLTVLVQRGESLKCYSCNSYEKKCGSDFDKNAVSVINCPEDAPCRKVKHFSIGVFIEPITRGCSDGTECDPLNVCLECDKDLCNSANYLESLFIIIIACIIHYLLE